MGNGASLLSPGKKRAQQQPRANEAVTGAKAATPAPSPTSMGVVASDTTPEEASADASKTQEGLEDAETDLTGDEDDSAEAEWHPGHADDAVAFLRAQRTGDSYTDYTLALALELEQDYDAASRLFRSALGHGSLGLSAHYHLALCLLRGSTGPPGNNDARICCEDEVVRCLERVVGTESTPESDDEAWPLVLRNSKELLAHVMVARKEFARALSLFQQLTDSDNNGDLPAAPSTPQTLAIFQQAGCLHALGDSLAATTALEKVDWELVRKDLPLVAADAIGIPSALAASTSDGAVVLEADTSRRVQA